MTKDAAKNVDNFALAYGSGVAKMQNVLDDVPTDALCEEIMRREVSAPGYELVVSNRGEYQLRICINSDGGLVIQLGVNTTVLYSCDLQRLRMMLNANA